MNIIRKLYSFPPFDEYLVIIMCFVVGACPWKW